MAISDYYTGLQGMDLSSLYNLGGNTGTANTGGNWNWLTGGSGLVNSLGGLALGGLQSYANLQNLGLAKKQLGLANKQFAFEKGLANRNLANQAQTINTAYDAAGQAAIGLLGGIDAVTGQTITPDAETLARAEENIKKSYVSGTPI